MSRIGPKRCVVCGTEFRPRSWNPLMVPICSEACKAVRREERRLKVEVPCSRCGEPVVLTKHQRQNYRRFGNCYCGPACRHAAIAARSARVMAEINRQRRSVGRQGRTSVGEDGEDGP